MAKKKKENYLLKIFSFLGKCIFFLVKIPYYIVKSVLYLIDFFSSKVKKSKIKNKRKKINANYEDFKLLKLNSGNYDDWLKQVFNSDSKIGIILGARGSGKTAFGVRLLENIYFKKKKECFAMGFNEKDLPSWIYSIDEIDEVKNNSLVLIDEGGILFNSRSSMKSSNKLLSELILISRHKNISIIFISQNSSNLDVNILRQADFLILKQSALLQKDFERKIVQKIYQENEDDFKKFKNKKGLALIYSDQFKGFVEGSLPSFWKESISKSWSKN
ncbi:MAG: zonular occludens toxin domain-containing protein [Candidatus Pacearchaeota archaeon]